MLAIWRIHPVICCLKTYYYIRAIVSELLHYFAVTLALSDVYHTARASAGVNVCSLVWPDVNTVHRILQYQGWLIFVDCECCAVLIIS